MKKILIFVLVLILNIFLVSAVSNVQHFVEGNEVTFTYQGTPPFLINIRPDTNIGQNGGYLWARTDSNFFTYDMSFANNPSNQFYYGIKDTFIEAVWSEGAIFELGQTVSIDEKCVELIPGHNDLSKNRINIVFVSINEDMSLLINHATASVNYDSDDIGLMAIEPFKSNKDKFNFFYVDEVGYVDLSTVQSDYGWEANPEIDRLRAHCSLNNVYGIALTDLNIVNNAEFGGNVKMRHFDTPRPHTVVHEFGHSFGLLLDERKTANTLHIQEGIQNRNCYFATDISCITEEECYLSGTVTKCKNLTTCFSTPESIADCEENSDWRDLIGNGCGEDGVIDCPRNYINITEEECNFDEGIYTCKDVNRSILEIPESNVEISCNLKCVFIDGYKSVAGGIMLSSGNYFNFGPFNERLLCNRIKDLTGSVGGICDDLCLDGCSSGEKCIGGVCQ
ncbi:MAG: hypothetical protein V3V78_02915 [Candidatus Woesearchaeota archaeon]